MHLGERHGGARGRWLERASALRGSGPEGARKPVAHDALFSFALRRLHECSFFALLSLANLGQGAAQELVFHNRTLGHAAVLVKGASGNGDSLESNGHAPLFLPGEDIIEIVVFAQGTMRVMDASRRAPEASIVVLRKLRQVRIRNFQNCNTRILFFCAKLRLKPAIN